MQRRRRRPIHYDARSLNDGTVLAAYPIRKPLPQIMKRDHLRADADGVTRETMSAGKEHVRDPDMERRIRNMDIISNRLNVRRAIRELVLPELAALRQEVSGIRDQLDRIEHRQTQAQTA